MKSESRNPKSEAGKAALPKGLRGTLKSQVSKNRPALAFGFRISDFTRISDFGFQISDLGLRTSDLGLVSPQSFAILASVPVVDLPGTNGMMTIRPPAASTTRRSSWFNVARV